MTLELGTHHAHKHDAQAEQISSWACVNAISKSLLLSAICPWTLGLFRPKKSLSALDACKVYVAISSTWSCDFQQLHSRLHFMTGSRLAAISANYLLYSMMKIQIL